MRALSIPSNASSWDDWRWQLENATKNADPSFPVFISPYYASLIDPNDPLDPIAKMAVPSPKELETSDALFDDPIDENERSPLPGIIRRYPDRAVLLVSGKCAVNCRHCTRRHMGSGNIQPIEPSRFDEALRFLRDHPEIEDVILSGGDPFLLEDDVLGKIVKAVAAVPSVEIIRIGTRAPVTLPMRVTAGLVKAIACEKPIFVNTQFNHPREITPESQDAISKLVDAGVVVSNQAVLLRGVNDSVETTEALCRGLLRIRVRPYYLFLCDLWNGLGHFRTSIDAGLEIMSGLQGRISGLAIPKLVLDLPGGVGKIPIGPDYIEGRTDTATLLRSPGGKIISYPDPSCDPSRDPSSDPSYDPSCDPS